MLVEDRWANVIDTGGDGEAVVLIHGLGSNWQCWLPTIPPLMARHRVISFDLPGFGYSAMPRDELSIPGYARWVSELLGKLEVERAAIVGNSLGGFVGADLAVNFPPFVDRLVLVTAAALWNERRRARPIVVLGNLTSAYASKFAAQWELAHKHPKLRLPSLYYSGIRHPRKVPLDLAWEIMSGAGAPGFANALEALFKHKIRDDLERIGCPTLVVWGSHDPLVPLHNAFEYEALIPDARVVVFNDCGHVPQIEKPEEFNAALAEFIASTGDGE
jgi:pimeloyl-ACP methyl ester carboxylesterase